MQITKRFITSVKISLILVYLVILAGALVRMTGSGMGCPDWPKCFGYLIPPTEKSQLEWQSNKEYKQGQVIIKNDKLWVANDDFTSPNKYSVDNWEVYTKHEYAIFNPWHTWIEFINRLIGALAGIATLILAILSIKYWATRKKITILSWLIVFGMGFQGWLGATVVYSVLNPFKITIHMIMALVIVAMLLYLLSISSSNNKSHSYNKLTMQLAVIALAFTLIQVVLGTQVREFVDVQSTLLGDGNKSLWLQNPTLQFYIHRTFSIIVVALNIWLAYRIKKYNLGFLKINWVLLLISLEVLTGIAMYYFDFPFSTQPLHLVFATLLFSVQCYLILETLKSRISPKTL